ncbi:hypothetical protein M5689_012599 [Euphorbia peplus]|nr:hypothetical protein M5689_012599 [Euphorbia peplus]
MADLDLGTGQPFPNSLIQRMPCYREEYKKKRSFSETRRMRIRFHYQNDFVCIIYHKVGSKSKEESLIIQLEYQFLIIGASL